MAETGTVDAVETPGATNGAVETSPPPGVDWTAHIPAELAKEPVWGPISGKPLGDVLKGYAEAQKLIGGSIRLPAKDAKPEELAKWKAEQAPKLIAAGLLPQPPAAATDYKVKRPEVAADLGWNDQAEQGFLGVAHELGLSQAQVDRIMGWYGTEFGGGLVKDIAAQNAAGTKALTEVWGSNFEPFLGRAERFISANFSEGTREMLKSSGVARDPSFIQEVLELANQHVEHGMMTGTSGPELPPEKISAQANTIRSEMMKANAGSQRHKDLSQQLENLYKQRQGLRR